VRIVPGFDDARWHRLEEPGSYEWWYFDALSNDGAVAIVVIWFASLPFSPDYLTRYERGERPDPRDYAAMFVGVYRLGRPIAYALDTYRRSDFEGPGDQFRMRIGNNTLSPIGQSGSRLDLDLPVLCDNPPLLRSGRLEAALTVSPDAAPLGLSRSGAGDHVWNPLALRARVTGEIRIHRDRSSFETVSFEGTGYVDHNYGTRPLTEGIERWFWGRVHFGTSGVVVYYVTDSEGGGRSSWLAAGAANRGLDAGEAPLVETPVWRRRPLCPRFPTSLSLERTGVRIDTRAQHVVDWGPFYMRFLSHFTITMGDGEREEAVGISEYLDPRALRKSLLRPLVRTRIRRVS
jgi:carotenoid 1,2-hydratase